MEKGTLFISLSSIHVSIVSVQTPMPYRLAGLDIASRVRGRKRTTKAQATVKRQKTPDVSLNKRSRTPVFSRPSLTRLISRLC